jgi:hypothetical protein
MSQELSFHDVDDTRTGPARPNSKRSGDPGLNQPRPERMTSCRQNLQARVRVPMLDWPSDLYSDDASMVELMLEDWGLQYDPDVLSHGRASRGMRVQAAA